jgi:branched-chain amino acid transport system substrate-binding protein
MPGKYAAAGYNALNILMDAIERAGAPEPDKIREALTKTDYEGPNGKFRFDEKGQAHGFSVVLVQITKNVPVVTATTSVGQ